MKKKHPDVVLKGAELFDATLFRDPNRTKCFYTFMAELKALVTTAKPTPTHRFLQNMQEDGRILRLYTQNIDDLEAAANLEAVQLHGTMAKVKCTLCTSSYDFTEQHEKAFRSGEPPLCPDCENKGVIREAAGKRQLAMGTLRPSIVLYNEDHPDSEKIGKIQCSDIKRRPDMLIVLGTSLKIPGLKKFVKLAARAVRDSKYGCTVLVNKTSPTKEWDAVFDYQILGDTDTWVEIMDKMMNSKPTVTAAWARINQRLSRKREHEEEDEKENRVGNVRAKRKTQQKTAATPKGQTTLQGYRVSKRSSIAAVASIPTKKHR